MERRPAWRSRSNLPTALILVLVPISVLLTEGSLDLRSAVLAVVATAIVVLDHSPGLLLSIRGVRVPQERLRRPVSGAAAVLLGLVVVSSGWSLAGWSRTQLAPCRPPVELRVMAAAETLRVARAQAEAFAEDKAAAERCRPVRVTVFRAPPLKPLGDALRGGWHDSQASRSPLATVGPRPDLWLASSRAIAEHVREGHSDEVRIDITPAQAVSPIVLAVSPAVGWPFGQYSPERWPEAVEWLLDKEVPLLRPHPETSDVAVVATGRLYEGRDTADARHAIEQEVSPAGVPLGGVEEMLCGVRDRLRGDERARVAVMVPEHSLHAFNQGAELGGSCPRLSGGREPVPALELVRLRNAEPLDYTLVRFTWQDERNADRERLAVELRDRLAAQGPRLGDGFARPSPEHRPMDVTRLREIRDLIARTREPRNLLLALDRSRSMRATATGGTAIDRAHEVIDTAMDWLGGNDQVGLWAFPALSGGDEHAVLADLTPSAQAPDVIDRELRGPQGRAEGGAMPLHRVLVEAIERLRPESAQGSVVVLTDGVNVTDGPASQLAALHDKIAEPRGARVFLVMVGERGCDRLPRSLGSGTERFRCLDFRPGETARQVVGELFAEIWKD